MGSRTSPCLASLAVAVITRRVHLKDSEGPKKTQLQMSDIRFRFRMLSDRVLVPCHSDAERWLDVAVPSHLT